jgi:hypothetical protein
MAIDVQPLHPVQQAWIDAQVPQCGTFSQFQLERFLFRKLHGRARAPYGCAKAYARRQVVNIQLIAALPPIPAKHMSAMSGFPARR